MLALMIDTLILVLLAGSIVYGIRLSRKVQVLMATLEKLEPLVKEYSSAVEKSEASVRDLRENLETGLPLMASAQSQPQPDPEMDADATLAEQGSDAPAFASRRPKQPAQPKLPGSQMVRDKKDLVRMFFDNSRGEQGV